MAQNAQILFFWEGTDKRGKRTNGELSSRSEMTARAELRRQGIKATRVRKKTKGFSLGGGGSVKPAEIQSDPTNLQALDEIKFHTGVNTETILVEDDKLQAVIDQFLSSQEDDGLGDLDSDDLEDLDMEAFDSSADEEDDAASGTDDTPIVRFVNKMLLDAIKMGASDIHFEPYEKSYRVRFRTDGILHQESTPPASPSFSLLQMAVPQRQPAMLRSTATDSFPFKTATKSIC